ncbi:MAG: 16S rRNA (cytosine(1402)-N(4))-methyltransferase [Flavobacteriales bacterium]|nr:16S rRNA (cytosine(1402)-N(4))-methyltransferase [Flavobacteriales bacterium]
MNYHNPVMLKECINGLNIKPNGVYVDATFGGGGHSKAILDNLSDGKLYSFDQDLDVNQNLFQDKRFKFIKSNFRYIKKFLKVEGIEKIDGLLADLGVSSHQIDSPKRGFSIRYNEKLDMRMNMEIPKSAVNILNEYSKEKLSEIFRRYGEFSNSNLIADKIIEFRKSNVIVNTNDLIQSLKVLTPSSKKNKFLARVFQAIRIEVNDELSCLIDLLNSCNELLKTNARIVVISYHSLEDRIVKNFIKKGNVEGKLVKDFFGNIEKNFRQLNKKIISPKESEIFNNPRSRSAKLRIAERI